MFENNPLLEPRMKFELSRPHDVKVIGVSIPGHPGYTENRENVQQLEQPFGYLYCLNLKRKSEFMLKMWLEKIPGSEDACRLLVYIMLIQDYLFDTVSMEPGYADKRENDRAEQLFKETDELAENLWCDSQGLQRP